MDTRQKERTARRRADAPRRTPPKKAARARRPAAPRPEIVYVPAGPFRRSRFLLRLLSVAAVVIAVVLGLSIFFKVQHVTVSGNEKYSAWTVREASGIQDGDNLLTFGRAGACGRILKNLPYVQNVRIGIELPDTVHITVTETAVVYRVEAVDGSAWLIRADGVATEPDDGTVSHTGLTGVRIAVPTPGETVTARDITVSDDSTAATGTADTSAATDPTDGTDGTDATDATDATDGTDTTDATDAAAPSDPSAADTEPDSSADAADRLAAALEVCAALEEQDLVGKAASVDVSDPSNLIVWYEDRYQIKLGDRQNLSYKLEYARKAIAQMADYESGVLDVSFTVWKTEAGYTPFS